MAQYAKGAASPKSLGTRMPQSYRCSLRRESPGTNGSYSHVSVRRIAAFSITIPVSLWQAPFLKKHTHTPFVTELILLCMICFAILSVFLLSSCNYFASDCPLMYVSLAISRISITKAGIKTCLIDESPRPNGHTSYRNSPA